MRSELTEFTGMNLHFRLFICSLFLSFVGWSQNRIPPLTRMDSEQAAANYQQYCALCHGEEREGDAADYAPSLKSKSLMSTMPLNFLASSIGFGRPGTPMAAYLDEMGGPMSMREIFTLSVWLKQIAGHEQIELPLDPIGGDLENGQLLFRQKCAQCHGKKGEGVEGPALANPAFLAFATDAYIHYAITNGRDETQMKAYNKELSEEERNDLTHYIRSLASGWSPEPKELAPYPNPEDYTLNPLGAHPEFQLKQGRYVPMDQVLNALNDKKRMVILDTRTSSEWHNAHIPGAIPMPYYISEMEVDKDLPKDGTWIIAYCACPHAASDKIINMLRKKGFENTAVIDEGFFKWLDAQYPITAGQMR